MIDISAIQTALRQFAIPGWLLYDFRGSNVLAARILELTPEQIGSRRFFYFIPDDGSPKKLVHRIESGALDHLPGEKIVYLTWQELEHGVAQLMGGAQKVAMEYSPRNGNPYVSRVDAGTVELVRSYGVEVVSSGDLVAQFEATLSDDQWASHFEADRLTQAAFERAWSFIADQIRENGAVSEYAVQEEIIRHFAENGMTTYHPPIVGAGPNSADPHYAPSPNQSQLIRENELVLIDLWAKMDRPGAIYSDLTKVGFVGATVPENYDKLFAIVAAARDAAIARVRTAFERNEPLRGWQVDQVARDVITAAGYGEYFVHRTGHSIGQETHGNGANMDNLETHEERLVLPRTCFSIEPGIYLSDFGVRSEVNVLISADGQVSVTGGLQDRVHPIC
jgi:Xaa-Pro aminopeptidase